VKAEAAADIGYFSPIRVNQPVELAFLEREFQVVRIDWGMPASWSHWYASR
jgi:hypothetical protein